MEGRKNRLTENTEGRNANEGIQKGRKQKKRKEDEAWKEKRKGTNEKEGNKEGKYGRKLQE